VTSNYDSTVLDSSTNLTVDGSFTVLSSISIAQNPADGIFQAFLDVLSIDVSYDYLWLDSSVGIDSRYVDDIFDLDISLNDISGVFLFKSIDIPDLSSNLDNMDFTANGASWQNVPVLKQLDDNNNVVDTTGAQLLTNATSDVTSVFDSGNGVDNGIDSVTLRHIAYEYFATVQATKMFLNDSTFASDLIGALNAQLNTNVQDITDGAVTKTLLEKMLNHVPERFLPQAGSDDETFIYLSDTQLKPVYGDFTNLPFDINDVLVFFINLNAPDNLTNAIFNYGDSTISDNTPPSVANKTMPNLVYAVRLKLT